MLRKIVAGILLVVVVFILTSCGGKSNEEMKERGRYLVRAAGVLSYHTPIGKDGRPDYTKFLAGSTVGYKGPWGVTYPKNLTPDDETGIGLMTDEEVISLIKEEALSGKLSIFNDYYKDLTDEDLKCIVVYLRSIDKISNKVPADLKPGEPVTTAVIDLTQIQPKVTAAKVSSKTEQTKKPTVKKPTSAKKKTDTKKTSTKKVNSTKKPAEKK